MRICGVTGDLPAVAAPPEPPAVAAPVEQSPRPAVAAPEPAAGATGERPRDPDRGRAAVLRAFDPPLIAQRAVLGLPVGMLIAEHAAAEGISYSAACAAVDRELPLDRS